MSTNCESITAVISFDWDINGAKRRLQNFGMKPHIQIIKCGCNGKSGQVISINPHQWVFTRGTWFCSPLCRYNFNKKKYYF